MHELDVVNHSNLISAVELEQNIATGNCVLMDCRFDLLDTMAGREAYLDMHIPTAIYADLDHDLAGPITVDSGRHPLPDPRRFADFLARSGWQPGKLLVAYDDVGGAIAARLWWLMRYFGPYPCALLDGGIAAWLRAGFNIEQGEIQASGVPAVELKACEDMVVTSSEIFTQLATDEIVLLDARAKERFLGKVEPIDMVAGSIPGAVNYPLARNLLNDGTFKPVADIRSALKPLLGNHQGCQLVHMCGSGVTACLNLFAADLAGFEGSRLYAGSWSEWIRDPSRPVGP